MHTLLIIHGLSGSGKTTLANYASKFLDAEVIDQDSFYLKNKPTVTLSNGMTVKNWDCLEAIDWHSLEEKVMSSIERTNVILVGFCLRTDKIKRIVDRANFCVELVYGSIDSNNKELCKKSRMAAKNIDAARDSIIVDEIVWPFYQETRKKIKVDVVVTVYKDGMRKSLFDLFNEAFVDVTIIN